MLLILTKNVKKFFGKSFTLLQIFLLVCIHELVATMTIFDSPFLVSEIWSF